MGYAVKLSSGSGGKKFNWVEVWNDAQTRPSSLNLDNKTKAIRITSRTLGGNLFNIYLDIDPTTASDVRYAAMCTYRSYILYRPYSVSISSNNIVLNIGAGRQDGSGVQDAYVPPTSISISYSQYLHD